MVQILTSINAFRFNKHVRLKSKQYFYYDSWYDKGIFSINDLLYKDTPTPVLKSFDDLIIEYDISYKDTKKYNSLMKSIGPLFLLVFFLITWFQPQKFPVTHILLCLMHLLLRKLLLFGKIFFSGFVEDEDFEWEDIHNRNLKCTIETQLRSFYFKIFHRAIAFNEFLLNL